MRLGARMPILSWIGERANGAEPPLNARRTGIQRVQCFGHHPFFNNKSSPFADSPSSSSFPFKLRQFYHLFSTKYIIFINFEEQNSFISCEWICIWTIFGGKQQQQRFPYNASCDGDDDGFLSWFYLGKNWSSLSSSNWPLEIKSKELNWIWGTES